MAIGVGLLRTEAKAVTRLGPAQRWSMGLPEFERYIPEVDLPVDEAGYPSIHLIDPYDTTVFSAYQCMIAGPEFDRLAAERSDPKFQEVVELINACASDPMSAIWFVGD